MTVAKVAAARAFLSADERGEGAEGCRCRGSSEREEVVGGPATVRAASPTRRPAAAKSPGAEPSLGAMSTPMATRSITAVATTSGGGVLVDPIVALPLTNAASVIMILPFSSSSCSCSGGSSRGFDPGWPEGLTVAVERGVPCRYSRAETAAPWCEMAFFGSYAAARSRHRFDGAGRPTGEADRLPGGRIALDGTEVDATAGSILDLPSVRGCFEVSEVSEDVVAVRLCGHWRDEIGGSGLFAVDNSRPGRQGRSRCRTGRRPTSTVTTTTATSTGSSRGGRRGGLGGVRLRRGPRRLRGDRDGTPPRLPRCTSRCGAVYFETTLEGAKRRGTCGSTRTARAAHRIGPC